MIEWSREIGMAGLFQVLFCSFILSRELHWTRATCQENHPHPIPSTSNPSMEWTRADSASSSSSQSLPFRTPCWTSPALRWVPFLKCWVLGCKRNKKNQTFSLTAKQHGDDLRWHFHGAAVLKPPEQSPPVSGRHVSHCIHGGLKYTSRPLGLTFIAPWFWTAFLFPAISICRPVGPVCSVGKCDEYHSRGFLLRPLCLIVALLLPGCSLGSGWQPWQSAGSGAHEVQHVILQL